MYLNKKKSWSKIIQVQVNGYSEDQQSHRWTTNILFSDLHEHALWLKINKKTAVKESAFEVMLWKVSSLSLVLLFCPLKDPMSWFMDVCSCLVRSIIMMWHWESCQISCPFTCKLKRESINQTSPRVSWDSSKLGGNHRPYWIHQFITSGKSRVCVFVLNSIQHCEIWSIT